MSLGGMEEAQALMDLILLSLYTLFPPSRALEIRTLQIFVEDETRKFSFDQEGNFVVLQSTGRIVLSHYMYKTRKTYGRDITVIEVCNGM